MGGIVLSQLKIISNQNGDIYHALKSSDKQFKCFGEAYFSFVNKGSIKGWKKHSEMTLNLIVPIGEIQFVAYDEINNTFETFFLSPANYQRLTIPPNYWLAFKGLSEQNVLLNVASIEHDPAESTNVDLENIYYEW